MYVAIVLNFISFYLFCIRDNFCYGLKTCQTQQTSYKQNIPLWEQGEIAAFDTKPEVYNTI